MKILHCPLPIRQMGVYRMRARFLQNNIIHARSSIISYFLIRFVILYHLLLTHMYAYAFFFPLFHRSVTSMEAAKCSVIFKKKS